MMFRRPHHQAIGTILSQFDPDFLRDNNILFGRGTRIALELDEFRESVDIDLFCIGKDAYRAARSTVTNISFGKLLRQGSTLPLWDNRDIRADRDAIRALLDGPHRPIKLEIINFANDRLLPDTQQTCFPIPSVNREGCFATKLTANADRYQNHIKDILDLCMMRREWGPIPPAAWDMACDQYGQRVIATTLVAALRELTARPHAHIQHAMESLQMSEALASELITELSPEWLDELVNAHMAQ
ncbi:MAG: nucleotidyl transferase AbiEii/AbiGii toxin family protein [Halomonas sp.]|uniref:nucleotidyl transferase AbiEii/AbiGii toxin family protein n=1 Tax=Halomonas sp. TaxID=1486246 RepID=UPI002870883B|nr:nucleotidyl transferase AbiEii/AbiGii toxin family protein [Halomonas sp.]MDR9440651.1 nucleotidyl transferase AbiEii/AbiGii toxin family protein [Halomonas sp.]